MTKISLDKIPLDDEEVFDQICEGYTVGAFQLETRGMTDTARKIKPRTLKELAVVIALFRPGSINHIDEYAENKRRGEFYVSHPALKKILKETHGIMVYQEQAMKIVHKVAGFSLTEADEYRKTVAKTSVVQKEKYKPLFKRLKKNFYAGCKSRGVSKNVADQIFRNLEAATGYAFNKSHAVSYAFLAYQMMWLKVHYPLEFMTSLLNREIGDRDKTKIYGYECHRLRLPIFELDVRYSGIRYQIEHGSIRPPLTIIKGIGKKAVGELVYKKNRKFPNLRTYMAVRATKDATTELLIRAGAFDYLGRRDMTYNEFQLLKGEELSTTLERDTLLDIAEFAGEQVHWSPQEQLRMQRGLTGLV